MHKKSSVRSSNADVPQKISSVSPPGLAPALIEFKSLYPGAFTASKDENFIEVLIIVLKLTSNNDDSSNGTSNYFLAEFFVVVLVDFGLAWTIN
jgi:hypothetical protein|tara:strand:+ start:356 stop:637 length:282 start_codon:yes stop_codon:yes gene_type:complete